MIPILLFWISTFTPLPPTSVEVLVSQVGEIQTTDYYAVAGGNQYTMRETRCVPSGRVLPYVFLINHTRTWQEVQVENMLLNDYIPGTSPSLL